MPLTDALLKEMIVCPDCHGQLEEDEPAARLRCTGCGLAYPVRDGIPIMLIDEADQPDGFVAAKPVNGSAG